jgi:uncharacterized membrane protein
LRDGATQGQRQELARVVTKLKPATLLFYGSTPVAVLAMWAAAILMATSHSPSHAYSIGEALAWVDSGLLGYVLLWWLLIAAKVASTRRARRKADATTST